MRAIILGQMFTGCFLWNSAESLNKMLIQGNIHSSDNTSKKHYRNSVKICYGCPGMKNLADRKQTLVSVFTSIISRMIKKIKLGCTSLGLECNLLK